MTLIIRPSSPNTCNNDDAFQFLASKKINIYDDEEKFFQSTGVKKMLAKIKMQVNGFFASLMMMNFGRLRKFW